MLKEERYDRILEILEEENYISAYTLSKRLFVSMPTVRRDLAELSRRKLIIRSHGGAKKISSDHTVTPLDFRKTQNFAEKRKLCMAAAKLVRDNDIVFMDASSTVVQMADFICAKKQITVVTNSIPLSVALGKNGIKTYCTGGEFQENSLGYAGVYAEELVSNFNFDIMFFSCSGVGENAMVMDTSLSENMLRKAVAKNAKKVVFLCDSTKLFVSAPYNLMPIGEVDCVITDAKNAEDILKDVKEKIIVE